MNPTPVAWILINSDGECEQIDYCQESPLPDDDGFKPLFTLAQMQQAKADALREAAELCDELETHYAGYADTALLNGDVALSNAASGEPRAARFIAEKLRKMAEEMEKGK